MQKVFLRIAHVVVAFFSLVSCSFIPRQRGYSSSAVFNESCRNLGRQVARVQGTVDALCFLALGPPTPDQIVNMVEHHLIVVPSIPERERVFQRGTQDCRFRCVADVYWGLDG